MPATTRRLLWPTLFLLLGAACCLWLVPAEQSAVETQMVGFPNSDKRAHYFRPILIAIACFLPAFGAILYSLSSTLDRYISSLFLHSFLLCFGSIFSLMIVTDFQNNYGKFQETSAPMATAAAHYLSQIPAMLVFILPYALMLGLLWCLGKMSKAQEIISMIQSGRSVIRITFPIIFFGLLCSLFCMILNYHWAPHAEEKKEGVFDSARQESSSYRPRDVLYQTLNDERQWTVGEFPSRFTNDEPLLSVTVTTFNAEGSILQRLFAKEASWNKELKEWTFQQVTLYHHTPREDSQPLTTLEKIPSITQLESLTQAWPETPWQIIKPGLPATHLGIPGLKSWLKNHRDHPLSNKLAYITQIHYRYAQPMICLITILIAAPLGIVFTRRGLGGGVAIAIFLCAGMLFCSTVFPTLGESGHLSPILAAWATNILFTAVALYLFQRRVSGRPIYQTLKQWLPSSES